MKKAIAVVLALILAFSLVACGKTATEKPASNDTGTTQSSNTPASSGSSGTTTTPTNPNAPSNETSELTTGTGDFTPSDEVLRIAHKGNPTGMCVLNIAAVSNNNPCMICLYDQLVSYDYVTKEVGPEIATEWKYLDDTHIEFTLRDDVYSHAGDHLTASDVIFSVKTAIESTKLTKYYDVVDFDECKAIDDTHVVLATKYVNPFFLMSLSNTPMSIIVEASVEKNGGLENENLHPTAGTGPYKFVEWQDGAYITFERNEEYWKGPRYYKEVDVLVITDASARVMNVESGDAEIALNPDAAALVNLEGRDDISIINIPTANIAVFSFNTSKEEFKDINVRQAIAHAIDYVSDIKVALNNYGSLTDTFLPTASSAYVSSAEGGFESSFTYNVDLAKEYMAKSAYPNGFEFNLIFPEGSTYQNYADLIQNQLKAIGITMHQEPLASSVFYERCNYGDFEASMLNNANPDPAVILTTFDPLNTYETVSGNNSSSFIGGPEELGKLIADATVSIDAATRKDLYTKIQAMHSEQVPTIPLYSPNFLCVANSDIVGLGLTVYGDIEFSGAYRVQ